MPLTARPPTPASARPVQRLGEGDALAGGPGVDPGHGGVAHPPLRGVQHPLDRDLVGRVHHRLQVGHRVLDLAPVVEAGAAHHLVGDAAAGQGLLQHPALGVGPVEDGHVAPPPAVVVEHGHAAGDPLGLVGLVVGVEPEDGLARTLVGPQLLGLAGHVVGDDRVGRVEHRLGRPVVLLQQHHVDLGERRLEVDDVAHVGATELVDAVVHQDAPGREGVGRRHLEVVDGALVLLDRDRVDTASTKPPCRRPRPGRSCPARRGTGA